MKLIIWIWLGMRKYVYFYSVHSYGCCQEHLGMPKVIPIVVKM